MLIVVALVHVALLPKLTRLTYSAFRNNADIFIFASKHLSSITSTSNVAEIHLDVELADYEAVKDVCGEIDNILNEEMFPSLKRMEFTKGFPLEYFPVQLKRGVVEFRTPP